MPHHGDGTIPAEVVELLLQKIPIKAAAKIGVRLDGGCWLWYGATGARGRPFVCWRGHSPYLHKALYEIQFGRLATGVVLRHSCDEILCVNPWHLQPGTRKDNIHDAFRRQGLNIKVPQSAVEKLRNGSLSVTAAAEAYNVTVKHCNAIISGYKRKIDWS